ncbi:hypothetical protein PVK06_020234 [Gossypium arboreum]|uniref:Uncharacterized protein n=1 Tax=Gossypium arboreum TaxID=29729 RepID=A0ABR0PM62_GOSAR|nr:hypothetical protein PVK06_020234 [Gossypium arboreum]
MHFWPSDRSYVGAFQWILGANLASAPTNPALVNQGLPLEHLQALGSKEFSKNVEMFDELVKRAKAVEETLIESPQYVVTKSSKRKFDGASGRPPKRGNDNHSSSRGTRHGSQPS